MNRQFDGVNRRLDRIDEDLKHFHDVTGNLEGRIDELSRRWKSRPEAQSA